MTPSRPTGPRTLDLATLAAPGTIARPGRLYGAVRDTRGETGRRTFIAALPAGAAVFPLAAPGVAFVLVEDEALPDSPWFAAGDPAAPAIDAWYGALLAAPGLAAADASARPLAAGESHALPAGATVTVRQVLWLKADRPALRYAGPGSGDGPPAQALLVLADQVTVTTTAEATVQCFETAALAAPHSALRPDMLAAPMAALADQLGRHLVAHDTARESRPVERHARDEAGLRAALSRLGAAAALRPVAPPAAEGDGDPLTRALAAIARHEGIKLRPGSLASPDASLLDRLEQIGDASGFRVCEVALEPGWWQRESAPFIARTRTGDAPRAALWRRGRWRLIEAEGGRESVVDAAVAARLTPVGLMIHPSLPETATPREVGRFVFFGTR
ncbi:MAG: hypothetical protein LCH95_25075, partial [Proteobacteria bacterium]|nr:hypothetical protein [Pseudomonadota bacterium]